MLNVVVHGMTSIVRFKIYYKTSMLILFELYKTVMFMRMLTQCITLLHNVTRSELNLSVFLWSVTSLITAVLVIPS